MTKILEEDSVERSSTTNILLVANTTAQPPYEGTELNSDWTDELTASLKESKANRSFKNNSSIKGGVATESRSVNL